MNAIEGNTLIHISWLNKDRLFEIACIIDNEYRQYWHDKDHFVIERSFQKIKLKTTKCDWASFICIYYDGKQNVTHINVLGEYTLGWQPITEATLQRIIQWYNQNKKPSNP